MNGSGISLAKVTRVVPGGHAVDLLFMDTGDRVPAVQVMTGYASGDTGLVDLVQPDQGEDQWDPSRIGEREVIACVSYYKNIPVVIGFLFPQVCQMLFDRQNFKVDRHASDVYTTTDNDGNHELFHPSGTYLRIGTAPAHEDLTGLDFDKKWAITKNTDKAVHVHLSVRNAGAEVASLDIDPAGNVTLGHSGNYTQNVGGDYALIVAGNSSKNVTGSETLTADTVQINSTTLKHNTKNIGDTHTHGSGAVITGITPVPNA
jgi:hypothetical protein